ncbi:MAG: nucleoside hydrolase [Bacteroidota bacterium]|nr:nucleoside hydrolase [Bacteroidota bacterium]
MIYKKLICFCFLLVATFSFAQKQNPIPIIFDSDMGPDYDDVGAIAMLHAFADSGYVKILATVASTRYEGVAGVFSVLNTYFNRPNLPIGIPKENGLTLRDWQHWSDSLLANYPHAIKNNNEVPDATEVYRKVLAAQPDNSVTIVTVGFFTNLSNLLKSLPDKYSKLNGEQLVKKKVKQLVSMAGRFPSGKEFNVEKDAAASQYVFTHWPTPVLLSGFEIGMKIKVGLPLMHNEGIQHSPVKDVFRISIPKAKEDSAGRMSWDETAVLVAAKGYAPWYTVKQGTLKVADDGSNTWEDTGTKHEHLVEKAPVQEVQNLINRLIMHQPATRGK